MRIIGLTGGIGSGKSTVAEAFVALGAALVDTDQIAHALSQAGQAGAKAVAQLFGDDYLNDAGSIDRAKLRKRIFTDAAAKQRLESALHPLIYAEAIRQLAALPDSVPYALLAVPLLFETGSYAGIIDESLLVDCPEKLQIRRVMARSQLSRDEVLAIMHQQLPRATKLAQADEIILNDADLDSLLEKVKELHKKYTQAHESEQDSA